MAAAYLERLGERIRTRREELNLSRAEVARRLPGRTNENAIYRWEKGQHRPNDDTLEALAAVLDTSVSYFLSEDSNGKQPIDLLGGVVTEDRLARNELKLNAILDLLLAQREDISREDRLRAIMRAEVARRAGEPGPEDLPEGDAATG